MPMPDLRVVLVGRTGLDSALRLDPMIELVRVGSALEAVGEVASPPPGVTPARTAVVISHDAEAALDDRQDQKQGDKQSEKSAQSHEHLADFVASLRLADPHAVVLGVNPCNGTARYYDALVSLPVTPHAFRLAIARPSRGTAAKSAEQPHSTPASLPQTTQAPHASAAAWSDSSLDIPPAIEPRPAPMGASGAGGGDLLLVTLLLKGQDPEPAAVAMLRERSGDNTLIFHTDPAGSAPAESDPRAQPVAWEGVVFGRLTASRTAPGALAQHARWLAGWLRLRDQQAQLRTAAFTDPLTGAWNRRYFDRFLATAIDAARAGRRPVTILLFDIDNFKHYNDRYGHEAGDEILRETVRLLRSVIRPTDRVCRVGGDEFAVIFHEPDGPRQEGSKHPATVFQLAQRFQQQVQKHRFPKLTDCAAGTLTISGGLATFPWDGATPAELLAKADQLAMASKRQGKNAITLGPGAMHE
jgi:diguanylate cyclase (GGDEF)-like protein